MKTTLTCLVITFLLQFISYSSKALKRSDNNPFGFSYKKEEVPTKKNPANSTSSSVENLFPTGKKKERISITGAILVSPLSIYGNDVSGGATGINRQITIKNTGGTNLTITAINLSGTNSVEFIMSGLPSLPYVINSGNSVSFSIAFSAASVGLKTAAINILNDDPSNSNVTVSLRGLGTAGLGGTNEPSLQAILNLLQIQTNVGDDNIATSVINSSPTLQKAALIGDEIPSQKFLKAGTGNVTITPLAVFGPTDSSTIVGMGWYKSGDSTSKTQLYSVSNSPLSNGQTVNVNYTGSLSFDPASASFGFYSRWPYFNNRHLYSEDILNTFSGSIPHHVRVYPYKKNNILIPNSYVVTFEEHISGFDYQDIIFLVNNVKPAPSSFTLSPLADSYVRNGASANSNFGSDTIIAVKGAPTVGTTRVSYLKFLVKTKKASSAKLRLYGRNTENNINITASAFGINDDIWTENTITYNNAPSPLTSNKLSSSEVNDIAKYYEFDVTDFVKYQSVGDTLVSFAVKDMFNGNRSLSFNSKENSKFPPQLIVDTATITPSNSFLFIENPDLFPSNTDFVFSRIQTPWTRDTVYNANHDSLKVRIRNKGISPLIVSGLSLSNDTTWRIEKLNGAAYNSGAGLPATVNSGNSLDLILKFIAKDQAVRVKVLNETLTITSNDDKNPVKNVNLHGLWQKLGEGNQEPYAQEIIDAFGYTTSTGFEHTDLDFGDSAQLKGDEIKPSYFLRADTSFPVTIRQMSAYHGCCQAAEKIQWNVKGSNTFSTIFLHVGKDGQTLLPRRSLSGSHATGTINPTMAFGFKIGSVDLTDASKTPGKKIGIRIWKVFDKTGSIVPNSYIISNDYLGSPFTNYDYNDNTYYVSNIKPEIGTVYYSTLKPTPSSLDFGEKYLGSYDSLQFNIKNLGQTYSNGSSDPSITISSVNITGDNRFEFSSNLSAPVILTPQQTTSITIKFKPTSQGLKIADLNITYSNSLNSIRIPLYGIAKTVDSAVVVNYRIKSGSSTPYFINGKTWSADTPYAFDNLEPYTNPTVKQVYATDEDFLYFTEQSSNGDKRPFRYEIPLPNGNYIVRLHFAEVVWGASGPGYTGGGGARVQSVKFENQYKLINFDIAGEIGSTAAIIKNIPVTITDGKLNIDFSATVNRPSLSAVEVYSFVSSGPLAENDLILKGSVIEKVIELNWKINDETNTDYYEVEKSVNNIDFIKLDKVNCTNSLSYKYTDLSPGSPANYYRIKQVNKDGKIIYSRILRISFSSVIMMDLYPNPTANKIKLEFKGLTQTKKANLVISNLLGSKVKEIPILLLPNHKLFIDVSFLQTGEYFIRVASDEFILNKKFVKK